MTDTPAGTPAGTQAPLDEVMLAMDVVDTLRHRERVVERALSTEEQDQQMVVRLREIYAGQGIEVSDAVLERGVQDLRANRFVYTPAPPSFGRSLARLYVSRGRWGKPVLALVAIVAIVAVGWQVFVRGPEQAAIAALPEELEQAHAAVLAATDVPAVEAEATSLRSDGEQALAQGNIPATRAAIVSLDRLQAALVTEYEVRIVSEPGEASGVWRIPEANPNAQNYYLIVEAVDEDGRRLALPVTSEETNRTSTVTRWGQRVDEATFEAAVDDKGDDGIIQNAVLGEKRRGVLEPAFDPGVQGGRITDW
jgi:hypothetical protein